MKKCSECKELVGARRRTCSDRCRMHRSRRLRARRVGVGEPTRETGVMLMLPRHVRARLKLAYVAQSPPYGFPKDRWGDIISGRAAMISARELLLIAPQRHDFPRLLGLWIEGSGV